MGEWQRLAECLERKKFPPGMAFAFGFSQMTLRSSAGICQFAVCAGMLLRIGPDFYSAAGIN